MAGRIQGNLAGAASGIAVDLSSDYTPPSGIRGVWVGTGGNLKVDYVVSGTAITLKNVGSGFELAGQFSKIYSTANGTTAADIVALY